MKTVCREKGKNILNKIANKVRNEMRGRQAAGLFLALVMVAYAGQGGIVYDDGELIRFHVVAEDNSSEKQDEKLALKDAVLAFLKEDLEGCDSVEESREFLMSHCDRIEAFVNEQLAQWNSENRAEVYYGRFDFPLKYYGAFSLPGGEYEALRIVIGDGMGENWWCVLYPQMCFSAASDMAYMESEPKKDIVISWRIKEWWDSRKE